MARKTKKAAAAEPVDPATPPGATPPAASSRRARKPAGTAAAPAAPSPETAGEPLPEDTFPIVGIGASAGGLDAFEQFFKHMPADSGIAFVLVQHMDPARDSNLPELLRRYTAMPVNQAADGIKVEPNSVYIIPPNKNLAILNGVLQLLEPTSLTRGHTVDFFFRSLAEDMGDRAIGIVLSGTGADGTQGVREIKGSLGMVMVHEPETAAYNGMPRSAVETGLADFVLPPAKMPEQLAKYVRQTFTRLAHQRHSEMEKAADSLKKIFFLIRNEIGHDFSGYKEPTIIRRIERRMSVNGVDNINRYVAFLQEHPGEIHALDKDFLINVTGFFRDAEAFHALKEQVRELVKRKPEGGQLRVWVPGCATGEEAYSVAIVVCEIAGELKMDLQIQIFATDIDGDAAKTARAAAYPLSIARDVGEERLRRFFSKKNNFYHVKNEIREAVVFAVQNILKDPPFSRMDIISCRNLLIYLNAALQKKLLPLLHYALARDGILFLGPSESIGQFTNLFYTLDRKWKIYQRLQPATGDAPAFYFPAPAERPAGLPGEALPPATGTTSLSLPELAEKTLGLAFIPPSVIIDRNHRIIFVHGRTGKFLEPAPGAPNWTLPEMARDDIKADLAAAINEARLQRKQVVRRGLRLRHNGSPIFVDLTVRPLVEPGPLSGLFLVFFEEAPGPEKETAAATGRPFKARRGTRLAALEGELRETRESLQTAIEEMETSNEELKSANEEYQSTNEELQSTNEELETSREELQSLNEELMTANAELQLKNDEMEKVSDDIGNLLNSTTVATIFVDNDLLIRRYTPTATGILNLLETDIGRPMEHITSRLAYEDLVSDARKVVETRQPRETEVQTRDGRWYLMRILPYRTREDIEAGDVISFIDIDERKRLNQKLRAALDYAESVVDTLREPLLVLDADLRVVSANRSFHRTFRMVTEDARGKLIYDLGGRQWDIPELRRLLEDILPKNTIFENFEVNYDFPGLGCRRLLLNARRLQDEAGAPGRILLAIEDAGEVKSQKTK
ncbi:MAG: PAS domain-containing protein [Chloroflexi bacterium]|nr:PAS domain-containing protein [Chloroflexota bacterium]